MPDGLCYGGLVLDVGDDQPNMLGNIGGQNLCIAVNLFAEVVQNRYFIAAAKQIAGYGRSNKAGSSSDKNSHKSSANSPVSGDVLASICDSV
jgi:hypothetical protein